jgi:hypothetical protein
MLVDTGASDSAGDHEVIAMLGLQPTGAISIATPSHDHHDVLTYAIDLMLEQNQCHLSEVPVFATGLQNQGIRGLIGRDVLKYMLLVYNGYAGHCTLAVSSPRDNAKTCSPPNIRFVSLRTPRNQRLCVVRRTDTVSETAYAAPLSLVYGHIRR